ncbi:nucleotidyltransferase domain-containing protein [Fictibacillus nanhaiensis]|uniref:nucleotidyltransferase domain-containing protein n=1 Tax=Fictibacillus nanhaiensis TaxID=742169 RepID=UPI001C9599AD|nr:nucleotidyltransferase domain-containing protein [Fictibacillus nanhaiensis]MBY6036918.1 nucleotidyltransferase domain-containing protein [Fictibacillus nanhaiensis]
MNESNLFDKVKKYLMQKYRCHTIILYGSYSRGDFTDESDLDIVCFSDTTDDKNDVEAFEDIQLDVWIYNTKKMNNPEEFLRVHEGRTLLNERSLAEKFLLEIQDTYKKGPKQLSNEERVFLKSWLKKMYIRSTKNDIEGNYRFHWMLKDSLEIYFELKGLWYFGPKSSFVWLRANDEMAYALFNNALARDANQNSIEQLFDYINEI